MTISGAEDRQMWDIGRIFNVNVSIGVPLGGINILSDEDRVMDTKLSYH